METERPYETGPGVSSTAIRTVVELWSEAAVLCLPSREIMGLNAAAGELIEEDPRLTIRDDRLRLVPGPLDRRLGQVVDELGATGQSPSPLVVPASPIEPSLVISLANVRLACLVVIRVLRPRSGPCERILRAAFDLTPAQARLAVRLGNGLTLNEIADDLGVSVHTARTHLKQIFGKTNTSRQAELMSLLMRAMPPL